ncbi:hypothetical protein GQX73_g5782 [Xylaria multiplex]|uniref:RRM domain-containing protein n=1 Tax=Xylaria multiplex TaxID=323545 RepID=A0A7C8IRD9_9PEZI|nr:hypothetical protein GQX73_g5782 [Xylaria multiplex]
MTEIPPEVWATANLDPISPAPVHPPSPITVPALQHQADAYFDMPLPSTNQMTLNVEATPGPPEVDERIVPTVRNSKPNGALDTRIVDSPNTSPDKASNGVAKRGVAAPAGIDAESMQEPETLQSDTTGAKQDVSMSAAYTPNLDMPALVSAQLDIAASAHGNNASIPQALLAHGPAPFPRQIPQSPASLPQNSQTVRDRIMTNGVNGEHSLPNNNHPSLTNLADYSVTNIQGLVDGITTHTNDVTQDHASRNTYVSDALPRCILPLPKPFPIEHAYTQPRQPADISSEAFQPGSALFPSSQALHDRVTAVPQHIPSAGNTFVPTTVTSGPNHAIATSQSDSTFGTLTADRPHSFNYQTWDAFLEDERQYIADSNWGNLAGEQVTRKDVFDLFSKYGRLAQISLKRGFGFIQYHTVKEGRAAIKGLRGVELGGKKINPEVSREQWKGGEGNRTNQGKRNHNSQNGNRGRRSNHRARYSHDDNNNRDSGDRRRSLSPGHDIYNTYRRRDDSPYHRQHTPVRDQSQPPRFGVKVPDVLFLLRDVRSDFVSWVEGPFVALHLSVEIISLSPRLNRDEVIRHWVDEGVRAVVDLDTHAQRQRAIPLLLFDRHDGPRGRYDRWQDLSPDIAARLVDTARSQSQTSPSCHQGQHAIGSFTHSTQGHYMQPSRSTYNYSPFFVSGAGHAIPGTAAVSQFPQPRLGWQGSSQTHNGRLTVGVDTFLAAPGTIPRATGTGPPSYLDMNYTQPQPNLPPHALHSRDTVQQVQDILTQLAGNGL